ncbi:MAG: cytochrome C [Candidatus Krumholzibacteriia bacterium]
MKRFIVAVVVVGFATGALANGTGSGISGSPHDFSSLTANPWNTREELCRVCHVPHDHQRDIYPTGLLWNHEVTSQVFTPYTMMDGSVTGQPDGVSKLCLGCHDGTVGIDEWDGKNIGAGTVFIGDYDPGFQVPGAGNAGSLARTHPLSVAYNYDPADNDGLNDPATTPMGSSGMIADVLPMGKVQCSSCHDVHDNESVGGTHLLRIAQKASQGQASGLCLACHNK